MQSRSTRDNHVQDDERSQLISEHKGLPTMSTSSSTGKPARNRYTRINDEVDLSMSFPTMSFLRPLMFRHPPEENSEFIWPNPLDPPNQGIFALTSDTANRKFLSMENRLFELTSMRPMIILRIQEHCSITFRWNSDTWHVRSKFNGPSSAEIVESDLPISIQVFPPYILHWRHIWQ